MGMKHLLRLALLGLALIVCQAVAAPAPEYWAYWDVSDERNSEVIDHSAWDSILQKYAVLDPQTGIVSFSYGKLSRDDRKSLDRYVDKMEDLDPREYSRLEQKAYWMNLYNALTIQAVEENYKELSKSQFQHSLDAKARDKKRVKIERKKLSLNDIEHRILRPIYRDHRVLFGLNRTTRDCPNLPNRAFTASNIKTQLKAAGRRFINNNIGLRYADGVLSASWLFEEYMTDFADDKKTLQKVFAHYAQDMKALYVLGYTGTIQYMRDPRLNIR